MKHVTRLLASLAASIALAAPAAAATVGGPTMGLWYNPQESGRGYDIDLQGEFSNMVGGGQAVMHDAGAQVNYGGSDPRKDGCAVPEPLLGS